jgi:trehalose 6-phosphate synthase
MSTAMEKGAALLKPTTPNTPALWNAASLRSWLVSSYAGESIVVLANRQPFREERGADGRIAVRRSSGGLVTALEPVMDVCSGVWIASGNGGATSSSYRMRRVPLSESEEQGYYYGFSNEGLWPLCHRAGVAPIFRRSDFAAYYAVNDRFAEAVWAEAESESPLVLVQDYHVALAPAMIRRRSPRSTIVTFWHIPFPNPAEFATCPWGRRLLDGLLGSTIAGFQTQEDCGNFLDCVETMLVARVDRMHNTVTYRGREITVRAYPVSVEWPSRLAAQSPTIEECRASVRGRLGIASDVLLGLGVDRLDYTKGIDEKFLAVERLLESRPEFRERFVFAQIAEPSRNRLPAYREIRAKLLATAERVNQRFGAGRYRPIVVLESHHEPPDVFRFMRAADLCYVGSLHDGMNLVAKEFVAARDDQAGVLMLSKFAGAARELTAATIVDPRDIDACGRALASALTMSPGEQTVRMRALRSVVQHSNGYRWAGEMLADASALRSVRALSHPQLARRAAALPAFRPHAISLDPASTSA